MIGRDTKLVFLSIGPKDGRAIFCLSDLCSTATPAYLGLSLEAAEKTGTYFGDGLAADENLHGATRPSPMSMCRRCGGSALFSFGGRSFVERCASAIRRIAR